MGGSIVSREKGSLVGVFWCFRGRFIGYGYVV